MSEQFTNNGQEPGAKVRRELFARKEIVYCLITLLLTIGAHASSATSPPNRRHSVQSIAQLRRLKPPNSQQPIRAHFRAIVTYYDSVGPNLFVEDETGGIWVDLRGSNVPPPMLGQLLELDGEAAFGFTPYLAKPEWKALASVPMPRPLHLRYEQAVTGSFDSRWAQMEGVVRSFVHQAEGDVLVIDVATPTGQFKVRIPDYKRAFPMHLVDAKVRFRGVCGAVFNRRNQLVAVHLLVPALEYSSVLDPAPAQPFDVQTTPIQNVRRFSADLPDVHRVKVVGVATARFPGRGLFLMDSTGGLYAETQDGTPVQPGDELEVIGFPIAGKYTPVLKSSSLRPTGKHQPLASRRVDGRTAVHGGHDAQLIEIAGTLNAVTRHANSQTLLVQSEDGVYFEALLEGNVQSSNELPAVGSKLVLAGICSVKADENGNASEFQLILRDRRDIRLLQSPSWLTAQRAELVLLSLAALTIFVLGWVLILRKRVAQQTAVIQTRLQHELALEERYRSLFQRNLTGLYIASSSGTILDCNAACARILGYSSSDELLAAPEYAEVVTRPFHQPLRENGDGAQQIVNAEHAFHRRDGTTAWVLTNVRMAEQADVSGPVIEGALVDITDRKVAEEQIQFLAYYDSLTGLPNRTLLHDRLSKSLAGARRHKEKVAVLFLDLDRFKIINDSLGHSFGDLLLGEVSTRLQALAREQDTVARVGGDEFVVILNSIKDPGDVAVAAERIVDALSTEFNIRNQSLNISCSIGISIFPDHGEDVETLIKNADAAMYCSKESGRQTFRFFTAEMNAQVVERLNIESNLRQALEKDELFLVYQPELDLATGQITTFEALIRWQHPIMGLVPPDRFIRIAENTGLIISIGEWVLRTACTQARQWQQQGLPPVPVAINVSAVQFRQDGFCDTIRSVLAETELPPQYLELELTESLLLSNEDVMFHVLEELRTMGVKLAIDDFGTGYSSLSYLRQFPVHKLKIDRSFIRDLATNPDDAAITAAIINMGKSLNLTVIAEGVETGAQMDLLRVHSCDEVQGYYFSKPMKADSVWNANSCPAVLSCRP